MSIRTVAFALILGIVSAGIAKADCQPDSPAGHFEGTAKSEQTGELAVTLDLRCSEGQYAGVLTTPLGNFAIKSGGFKAGVLSLQFEVRGDTGVIEARVEAGTLRGTFRVADDGGPFEARRSGDAKPPASATTPLKLRVEQWRSDLRFFADEMAKKHLNAFHYVSRERFSTEIAKLDSELPRLDADGVFVGLQRLVALVGDGHTTVRPPIELVRDFPIGIRQFGSDYRIVSVAPGLGLDGALGTRLVRIQDTPVSKVVELLLPLTPQDEPGLAPVRIPVLLTFANVLHGLGIIEGTTSASFIFVDDGGREFSLDIPSMSNEEESKVTFVRVSKQTPLYVQRPRETFWFTYLSESKTVYCQFRAYNQLSEHGKALMEFVKQNQPDKLVIDMRLNGGGDYFEGLKHIVQPIRDDPKLNRKGHLFVLIGPATFSAAMANATHFRYQTAAILVGQPIGEKPNSYSEPRNETLPNSHFVFRYQTKFYKFVESGENIVRPDQEIEPSWDDYKSGYDTALEWVLKYPPSSSAR